MNEHLILAHIPPRKWWQRARWLIISQFSMIGVDVPRGFITDGVSTPFFVSWLVSPTGKAMKAAVLHDYMLSLLLPSESRASADSIFYIAMGHCSIGKFRRLSMYYIVRAFGVVKVGWFQLWH